MTHERSSKGGDTQPPLVDSLLQYGKLGFNPEIPEETRNFNRAKFDDIIQRYFTPHIIGPLLT
jgi:hypothetical protein